MDVEPTVQPPPLIVPGNMAHLAAVPGQEKVHVQLRVNYDVTHLTESRQKLLLHYVMRGLKEFEQTIEGMSKLEVEAALAKQERILKLRKLDGNGHA
jgi:hypothetical protein